MRLLAALLTMGTLASGALAVEPRKPNVVVILCDDVGWAEFGFQGAKDIPTPHIDAIASGGVRFTQGYVSGPYCSPTRAGLLTGRYQTRFGHEFNSVARESGLALAERTIADDLKAQGYATMAVGKWHLGQKAEYGPWKRGFDAFYGTLANTSFFHPVNFVDTQQSTEVQQVSDPSFYTTDKYGEQAVDFIERNRDRPFFLYLPFNAQHAPLQAPQKYLDRFASIGDQKRRTFAAMMSAMDDAVGRVAQKLREIGQEENTLVFFLSDNGGPTQQTTSNNLPLRGFKATTWEGGVRVPFAMKWKGPLPAGKVYEHPVIQLDILPTVLAAAGATTESGRQLDGVDLLPYLTGAATGKPHETLYWRFGDQWAIRHGDWKLVVGRQGSGKPELYNLASDISESNNLAEKETAKASQLRELWEQWNAQQAPPSSPKEAPNRRRPRQQQRAAAKAATS